MKKSFSLLFVLIAHTAAHSQANTKLSNLISPTAVNQNLLPDSTEKRDLGTSRNNWKNLYLKSLYLTNLYFKDGSALTTAPVSSQWINNGTNLYYNTGNVGIGNSTPQAPVSFGNVNGNKIDLFYSSATSRYGLGIGTGSLQVYTASATTSIDFGYGSSINFTNRMSLAGTGTLTLKGPAAGYIFADRTSVNYGGYSWYANAGKANLYRYGSGGDLLTVDSLGQMGLNNTVPKAPLSFSNSSGNKIDLFYVNNSSRYGFGIGTGSLQIYTADVNTSIDFGFGSNSNFYNKMSLTGNGVLTLKGSSAGYIFADRTSTNYTGYSWYAAGGKAKLFRYGIGGDLITVDSLGQMGLGTSNPAYKLDVCGTIRAKEVLVQTGWCDYVFDNDYKLKSLEEVETYIKNNKHLPDVPAAIEVETNGIKLAAMDSILIKKVEELTLYVIQQNKQIEAQNQKIIALEIIANKQEGEKKNNQ